MVKDFGGKLLNGPNDIWIRDDGSAFFTDPFYKARLLESRRQGQDKEAVYFLSADGKLRPCRRGRHQAAEWHHQARPTARRCTSRTSARQNLSVRDRQGRHVEEPEALLRAKVPTA